MHSTRIVSTGHCPAGRRSSDITPGQVDLVASTIPPFHLVSFISSPGECDSE
jgi:hypothetical protein